MASLSGIFAGPGVSGSVTYAAGAPVTFGITGEWPRALVNFEYSADGGTTWTPLWCDMGITGASGRSSEGGPANARVPRRG